MPKRNSDLTDVRAIKKSQRIRLARRGKGIFSKELLADPERIEALLVGRKITWIIPNDGGELTDSAVIHRAGFKVVKYKRGLGIEFRESEKGIAYKYRCVLLKRICTVR